MVSNERASNVFTDQGHTCRTSKECPDRMQRLPWRGCIRGRSSRCRMVRSAGNIQQSRCWWSMLDLRDKQGLWHPGHRLTGAMVSDMRPLLTCRGGVRGGTNGDSQPHNRTLFACGLGRRRVRSRLVDSSEWALERRQCAGSAYPAEIGGRPLSWGAGWDENVGGQLHGWELGRGRAKESLIEEGRDMAARPVCVS